MHGIGGYGYQYDELGRLWKINSYNDNDQNVYHTTSYSYNTQGLLKAELKVLVGKSLFNDSLNPQAQTQTVSYQYHSTDHYGNWTYRTVIVNDGGRNTRTDQSRRIDDFADK